jgi:hypothetical protein
LLIAKPGLKQMKKFITSTGWDCVFIHTARHSSYVECCVVSSWDSANILWEGSEVTFGVPYTQQAINNIFADRQAWIEADEEIHHFNWMGLRVYTHKL